MVKLFTWICYDQLFKKACIHTERLHKYNFFTSTRSQFHLHLSAPLDNSATFFILHLLPVPPMPLIPLPPSPWDGATILLLKADTVHSSPTYWQRHPTQTHLFNLHHIVKFGPLSVHEHSPEAKLIEGVTSGSKCWSCFCKWMKKNCWQMFFLFINRKKNWYTHSQAFQNVWSWYGK